MIASVSAPSRSKLLSTPFIRLARLNSPRISGPLLRFRTSVPSGMAEYAQADPSNEAVSDQGSDRPSSPTPGTRATKARAMSRHQTEANYGQP